MKGERERTTRQTYEEIAEAFLERTRDRTRTLEILRRFAAEVSPGGLVLDVGGGPGFDASELRALGLRAVCADLSMAMLRSGIGEFPGPRVQADNRSLPFATGSADGVWANACLLHLDPNDLRTALREIARVCREAAPLHLSMKSGSGAGFDPGPYARPRWFQYWDGPELDALLEAEGFTLRDALLEERRTTSWLVRLLACPGA